MLSTGIRVGELVRLNIEDIDFSERECVVYGKGDKERKAYFDAKAKLHLMNYIIPRTDNNKALFVSLNRPHDRLTESGVELRLREMGKRLGVEKVHPHKFRRTMATRAIEKGMPSTFERRDIKARVYLNFMGGQSMSIELVQAYTNKDDVKTLFTEYTNLLIEGDSNFKEYLQIQNYDEELEHLEVKYGLPYGRLYLIYCDGVLAGCIGLRKIDDYNCEMKRLYVRPHFRGKHIGDYLIRKIIEDAKEIGYKHMLLDTLPFLKTAIHMYQKYGFYEISCYNNSPMDTTIYMRLDL